MLAPYIIGWVWVLIALITFIVSLIKKEEEWEIPVYAHLVIANVYFAAGLIQN